MGSRPWRYERSAVSGAGSAKRFRARLVEVEAMLFDGSRDCAMRIAAWAPGMVEVVVVEVPDPEVRVRLVTLEGLASLYEGSWAVRGLRGEVYPVDPIVMAARWEEIE